MLLNHFVEHLKLTQYFKSTTFQYKIKILFLYGTQGNKNCRDLPILTHIDISLLILFSCCFAPHHMA